MNKIKRCKNVFYLMIAQIFSVIKIDSDKDLKKESIKVIN
jgi:hypothetical protein